MRRVLLELASEDPKVADRITLLAQIAQQPSREASDTPRALRVTDFARDMVDDSIESLGAVGAAIQRLIEQADYAGALKLTKVLRHIRDNFVDEEIAAIYIHEGMYADALAILCESYALTPALARQIVDHEPASTRSVCLEEANEIILNARSRDYPLAADWLEVVKRSYYAEGKPHEWEAFIQILMEQHKRKTALIPLLRKLAEEG